MPPGSLYESNVPDWPGNDNNVHVQSDAPVPGPDCPRAAWSIPKYNVSPDAVGVTLTSGSALATGAIDKSATKVRR